MSHNCSHPNLAGLDGPKLQAELARPLEWLRARFDAVTCCVSHPYGSHSPAVETAARAAGYDAGLGLAGGLFSLPAADRYALPRLNIPAGLSAPGFTVWTSGLGRARAEDLQRKQR